MNSEQIPGIDFRRNNLDKSASPYLRQHITNPVWWQEWNEEILKYAKDNNRPILVSIGYSTCHWCHVMASEAFSDERTANYLNSNFVCVKVDRELRPDIDQYFMEYIQSTSGNGGWPLNVFMTSSLIPFFAMTYAPAQPRGSMPSFISIVQQVYNYFLSHGEDAEPFIPEKKLHQNSDLQLIKDKLLNFYDKDHGGFGNGQKFPSHSTLLFMLYSLSAENDPYLKAICERTLDSIRLRGLHDHLQGGIFRYCVDEQWTIPHFEKMLYDQAMALWVYSLAYRVLGNESYRSMAIKIISALDESFLENGFYITAHDADTEHKEGETYLWSFEELESFLGEEEFIEFRKVYDISHAGNFEGKNHLIRKSDSDIGEIERKLLLLRRDRKQPVADRKILSGNNSLTAIALVQAGRNLGIAEFSEKGKILAEKLLDLFWDGNSLAHSLYEDKVQKQSFLFDAASLFTLITFICEDDNSWLEKLEVLRKYLNSFHREGVWVESDEDDFIRINASWFDHPVPSGAALAEMGLARAAVLLGEKLPVLQYRSPYYSDFYNIIPMMTNGEFHVVKSINALPWDKLPVNTIQLRGIPEQDCYKGRCRPLFSGTFDFRLTD